MEDCPTIRNRRRRTLSSAFFVRIEVRPRVYTRLESRAKWKCWIIMKLCKLLNTARAESLGLAADDSQGCRSRCQA